MIRHVIRYLALAGLMLCAEAIAQVAPARIGWALSGSEEASRANVEALRDGLRALGHVEGRTYVLDLRYAEGQLERYPKLFEEIVRAGPSVILAGAYQGTRAASEATRTIPIVGISCGVELLVGSLARPTGNVTGVTCQSPELGPKQVQLLREALPRAGHLAVVYNPQVPYAVSEVAELRRIAGTLGVRILGVEVSEPAQFDAAATAMRSAGVDAVFLIPDNMVYGNRKRLGELLLANRLPMMSGYSDFAMAGGLMSYGSNLQALIRRAAWYADRVLKGARPADLPVEQPTKFELVINLRTAKALDLRISPALLQRADDVIQ